MHLEQNAVYKIQEQNGVCQIDDQNTVSKIVVDYGVFFSIFLQLYFRYVHIAILREYMNV